MSAKLAVVPDPVPLPVLVEDGFSQIFGAIDRLESLEIVAAQIAEDATDQQLIDGRVYAVQLGKTAWKIAVIFDAEIWRRAEKQVGGRGNKDGDCKGILKAVDKQAHALGCGASTIHANARIFKTFGTILTTQNTLEEKGFYQAALAAKDPHAALEHFSRQRSESPFYKPADAWRYVNAEKKPKKTEFPATEIGIAMRKLHDDAIRAELAAKITAVKTWPESTVDPLLATVYRKLEDILEWQRDRTLETDCAAIMKIFAAEEGAEAPDRASDDYIAAWLNAHGWIIGDAELDERLTLLMRLRMLTRESREGSRGPTQRGSIPDVYAADIGYAEAMDRVSENPRAPERLAAIRRDWVDRLTRHAPELLPKEEESAAA